MTGQRIEQCSAEVRKNPVTLPFELDIQERVLDALFSQCRARFRNAVDTESAARLERLWSAAKFDHNLDCRDIRQRVARPTGVEPRSRLLSHQAKQAPELVVVDVFNAEEVCHLAREEVAVIVAVSEAFCWSAWLVLPESVRHRIFPSKILNLPLEHLLMVYSSSNFIHEIRWSGARSQAGPQEVP
ncbi:hypothetical protein [Mycobacterium sherrisii]|uniref:hypothetical protein n=1 Tax=Mycobacterium sherrisii TaxID=243061 RepID=UPI001153A952|nr:hypothetical protein [Mycobacterium sherrisii]MCV7032211.1 hypothetical protein [Mycobacterium sherrisii]